MTFSDFVTASANFLRLAKLRLKKRKRPVLNLPNHNPILYLITNRLAFHNRQEIDSRTSIQIQINLARAAAEAGCQLIQIREKDLSPKALARFTSQIIAAVRPLGTKVLVNDRLDVALATGADGVHLRASSIAAREVREALERKALKNFLVGVSTHSLAEAEAAENSGADLIVCGPVYDTPSKREFGAPLGLERFTEICKAVEIPVLALGGINLGNFGEAIDSGAAGIAGIGLFTDLARLPQTISTILDYEKS